MTDVDAQSDAGGGETGTTPLKRAAMELEAAREAAAAAIRQTADEPTDVVRTKTREPTEEAERIEPERVKLTVLLPEREMATLRRLAAKRDISLTDAVRRAIAMEEFIDQVEAERGKLLVELPDRTIRQLIVR